MKNDSSDSDSRIVGLLETACDALASAMNERDISNEGVFLVIMQDGRPHVSTNIKTEPLALILESLATQLKRRVHTETLQ